MMASRAFRRHREALKQRYDVVRDFEQLEESCVPSYLHTNPVAARIAWQRLAVAVRQYETLAPAGPVLDFGAGAGVLATFLPRTTPYAFVELDDALAQNILRDVPDSTRHSLNDLPGQRFAAIFALDSLEHNDHVETLLHALVSTLQPDGVFILSGPTESLLYRLGRRLAGFSGHYHKTNIYDIETIAARYLRRRHLRRLPLPGATLFRVSAWSPR